MNVSVKFESETKSFSLSTTSTVGSLMDLLSESFNLPVSNQKLIFRGKTLSSPDSLLTSEGIKSNSRLLLIGSIQIPETRPAPPIPNPGFQDFSTRQVRALSDEYLTAPPHSLIIQKGPPQDAMEGSNYQLDSLPARPFIVRDSIGNDANLSFRSDDLVVDSLENHNRLFYQEITSFGIQAIPGYEQKYLAVVFHVKGKKLWVYFVPKQYRGVIEAILQHRRA